MFIEPSINLKSWSEVTAVWYRWQSLNVGVLALASSVIFYFTTKYKEEKQRVREFKAARAFLPESLSELSSYLEQSVMIKKEAIAVSSEGRIRIPSSARKPELPQNYREIFRDCIRHSKEDFGDHLSTILGDLQIHDSRMEGLTRYLHGESETGHNTHYTLGLIVDTGVLQARINKTFSIARGVNPFVGGEVTYDECINAYNNMDIRLTEIKGLIERTKTRIN